MAGFYSRFWRDNSGATSIEYALIASMIGMVILISVKTLGTKLSATYDSVQAGLP